MNDVEFVISKEDLVLGPGTRLDHSRAFVKQSFIKVKKGQRKLLTQTQKGAESALSFVFVFLKLVFISIILGDRFKKVFVAQSCLTLCDPVHCSTPGFTVLYLPEIA